MEQEARNKDREPKKKGTKKGKQKMSEPATASFASVYSFGIRTSQAIFVQDVISLFAEPLFDRVVAAVGIDDSVAPLMYRVMRVLFRFLVAVASIRCVGRLLGMS